MAEAQSTGPNARGAIRASDAERSAVADSLTTHFMDGRLDRAEFDERLASALGAKTRGELAALLSDLPRAVADQPVPAAPRPRAPRSLAPLALIAFFGFLVVAAASSLSMSVHRVAIAHGGLNGTGFVTQSQRVFSLSPVLVVVLLVAMMFLAVRLFRRTHDADD